jgi:hypothetical protein
MKWMAQVKSHGTGLVEKEFDEIGKTFDVDSGFKHHLTLEGKYGRCFKLKNGPGSYIELSSPSLGCGDWDLYEIPEDANEYIEQQKKCGLKVGDRVKIARRFHDNEGGFVGTNADEKATLVGKKLVITDIDFEKIKLNADLHKRYWPYWCLEKVEGKVKAMPKKEKEMACIDTTTLEYSKINTTKKEKPMKKLKRLVRRIASLWLVYGIVLLCINLNPVLFRAAAIVQPDFRTIDARYEVGDKVMVKGIGEGVVIADDKSILPYYIRIDNDMHWIAPEELTSISGEPLGNEIVPWDDSSPIQILIVWTCAILLCGTIYILFCAYSYANNWLWKKLED